MSAETAAKPRVLSISELNRLVKGSLEQDFGDVWVRGEISKPNIAPSGHIYFTLKDAGAQISAALFRGDASRIKFKLEHGLEIIARGRVTVYEARGSYQIVVRHVQPEAAGALQLAFEQLKKKLAAEGLFDEERKKPLPPYPRRIGLVTSRTGAAVRDMLSVLGRRFDGLHIRLYPVTVQGDAAAPQIAGAIDDFNRHFPDTEVLLVGRGGGSIEDLWAFNEESVARAIAASEIPVISCVGHETDFTIADFVADLRAPTPSSAAELAVCERSAVEERIAEHERRLAEALIALVRSLDERLSRATRSAFLRHPQRIFEQKAQRIDELAARLLSPMRQRLRLAQESLRRHAGRLDALSPLKVLSRGYAIAFKGKTAVRRASEVKKDDRLRIRLHEGEVETKVI